MLESSLSSLQNLTVSVLQFSLKPQSCILYLSYLKTTSLISEVNTSYVLDYPLFISCWNHETSYLKLSRMWNIPFSRVFHTQEYMLHVHQSFSSYLSNQIYCCGIIMLIFKLYLFHLIVAPKHKSTWLNILLQYNLIIIAFYC